MSIPNRTTMSRINDILVGFLLSGADQKPVSTKEASERSGVQADVTGRQMKFLCNGGFMIKDGASYRLTEEGTDYAKLLDWKQLDAARKPLAEILKNYNLAQKVIHYIRVREPVPIQDVADRVGILSDSPNTPGYRTGAKSFVNFLIFSGLVQEEEGQLAVGRDQVSAQKITTAARSTEKIESHIPRNDNVTINITINIDATMSPKKIGAAVKAIREALTSSEAVYSSEEEKDELVDSDD